MTINDSFDFLFQWHLTEQCNLRCRHCYQETGNPGQMPLTEIHDIMNEITDTIDAWGNAYGIDFSASFNITGGEPFLREDIFEILEELRARGLDTFILTNGILINKMRAERLSALGINGVQVSIEGPEKTHDAIRGKGSFSASVNGVRHLVHAGIDVTLNMTLSALNAGYFQEMLRTSADLGVKRLGFSRLVPYGRGEALLKEMMHTEAVRTLYENIFRNDKDGVNIVTGDPVASQLRYNGFANKTGGQAGSAEVASGGCAAGVSGITILADGTLVPCRRLPVPVGNIRKDSLREVWSMSEVLNALRNRSGYKGKCGNCSRWSQCRGCRAIAYAYSRSDGEGDILAEDPQCFIKEEQTCQNG